MSFGSGYATQTVAFGLGPSDHAGAPPPAPLASASANYLENRADGGYTWAVKYDLGFDGAEFRVQTRIDLAGADPGALRSTWEQGIESIWNDKVCLTDGTNIYPVAFDVVFVESGAHYTVNVHDGDGSTDMLNWYTGSAWGPSVQDEMAAHEYGHMIGMFDEYAGGATYNGYTTTGTLMSDLTATVSKSYFWSVDYYAETLCGRPLSVIDAAAAPLPAPEPAPAPQPGQVVNGTSRSETLAGGTGDDSVRGFAGNDTIRGQQGDDTLKGEAGRDTLFGGGGNDSMHGGNDADRLFGGIGDDILWGSPGNDTLEGGDGADWFKYTRGSGDDVITDFDAIEGDRIQLEAGQTHRVIDGSATQALVDLGGGDTILLQGIARHAVHDDWFVYA